MRTLFVFTELQKLKGMRGPDFQIAHNIAICQFKKAGSRDIAGVFAELQVRCSLSVCAFG